MKKIFPILIASLLLALPLKAQWKQTHTGQSSLMDAVCVVNDSVIWIKDQMGDKFSVTTDGGKTWITKSFPTGIASNRICGSLSAVSDNVAYVIVSMPSATATQGIYQTTDGGDTWTRQATAFNSATSFPDLVYFWNANEGVAIGDGISADNGILEIYTTTNGGAQWNSVPAANMPPTVTLPDWSTNTNSFLRIRGNTVYVMSGSGWIYKSANKGLNWTTMKTPALNNGANARFDFKDDNNGLLSSFDFAKNVYSLYSTSNAGLNWAKIDTVSNVSEIKYISTLNTYFSTNRSLGLLYSTDNGVSWSKNSSFTNVGLQPLSVTPSGSIYIGGWGTVFYTDNYKSETVAVKNVALTGTNTMDVSYTKETYLPTSTDTTNYQLSSIRIGKISKVLIKTITQDASDKTLMHLVMDTNLPSDSIRLIIKNIYDLNGAAKGNPMLYNEPGSTTTFRNYSISKSINITTPGTLGSFFTPEEKTRISQLTVTGTIDARDFKIIRDSLVALNVLNIGATTIAAYTGTEGTYSTASTAYIANELPRIGLYGKKGAGLISLILPTSITSIARSALNNIPLITSIVIPSGVTSIGQLAFGSCTSLKNVSIPNSVTSLGLGAFYNCTSLAAIHVYIATPLALSILSNNNTDVFYGDPVSTCMLYVPIGSSTLYKAANQWSSFTNVVEFDASIYHASLPDYSTVKYALIGSSYFLNNVSGGTKAAWNTCWKDATNNIQASVPVVSGSGKIFTWSFPAVLMVGGASYDGMFKFCIPNADNTPNWAIEPIGYPATNTYIGSASANVDRTFDAGGAFSILTAGLTKKYNLKLIIDQTTGIDQITLAVDSLTNYSTTKLGLIGNCYFLNNVQGGTKAQWNTCWKDGANNIQPSVPVVSGNGFVNTWNFSGVFMDGAITAGNPGMFKFCIPQTDNITPDWTKTNYGYPQTNLYSGTAIADIDKTTDGGGAFTLLTSSVKRYNLSYIIDQSTGVDKITLKVDYAGNTAIPSVNMTDALIVDYKIYTEIGILLKTEKYPAGLKLQEIKQKLNRGIYIINARLNNGVYQNYKFIVQ